MQEGCSCAEKRLRAAGCAHVDTCSHSTPIHFHDQRFSFQATPPRTSPQSHSSLSSHYTNTVASISRRTPHRIQPALTPPRPLRRNFFGEGLKVKQSRPVQEQESSNAFSSNHRLSSCAGQWTSRDPMSGVRDPRWQIASRSLQPRPYMRTTPPIIHEGAGAKISDTRSKPFMTVVRQTAMRDYLKSKEGQRKDTVSAHISTKQALKHDIDDPPDYAHSARQSAYSYRDESPTTHDKISFKTPKDSKTLCRIGS